MKILFACNTPDSRVTGMAKIMNYFAQELSARGHEVDLVFRGPQKPHKKFRRLSEILFPFFLIIRIVTIWKRKGRHDLVAIHSLEAAPYALLRKIFKSWPPCVVVSYGSDEMRWELELEEDRLGFRKLSAFTKFFYPAVWITQARVATQNADHVMLTAKCEISFNQERYGVPAARMTFIPNGVSRDYFTPRDYSRPARKLLYFGGWEWRKGTRYLIESFAQIAEKYPEVKLTLAGVGASEENVKACFSEDVRPRVNVIPKISVEDTPQIYAQHDIFVFPSLFESMSLVLPEAMASGMPVITTRTCGMQDIVENGMNGFLVRPRDAADLTEKIERLLQGPELRELFGKNARSKAEELLWEKLAGDLELMYQKVLNK